MSTAATADDSLKEWVFESVGDAGPDDTSRPIDFENSGCFFTNAIKRKREALFEVFIPTTSFLNPNSFDVVYFRVTNRIRLGDKTAEKQACSRRFLGKRGYVMGRPSSNPDKLPFQIKREELGLSREQAVKKIAGMTYDRLEGIENRRIAATPEDILLLAKRYNDPSLCNAYCSGPCMIGQRYVPEVKVGELPSIVLGMIVTLNNVGAMKDRLIAIAADGIIDEDEREDFEAIQNQLEELSIAVEALQLWVEKTLDKE